MNCQDIDPCKDLTGQLDWGMGWDEWNSCVSSCFDSAINYIGSNSYKSQLSVLKELENHCSEFPWYVCLNIRKDTFTDLYKKLQNDNISDFVCQPQQQPGPNAFGSSSAGNTTIKDLVKATIDEINKQGIFVTNTKIQQTLKDFRDELERTFATNATVEQAVNDLSTKLENKFLTIEDGEALAEALEKIGKINDISFEKLHKIIKGL